MLIQELIEKELQRYDFIRFAFLFGSYSEGRATDISDIDVGIYTDKVLSLIDIGLITAHLEKRTRKKADLLILNDLHKKKPVLSFEVISKGKLIFCKDHMKLTEFKKNVFLSFIDTKPLRDKMDKTFINRLKSGHFGERNYA